MSIDPRSIPRYPALPLQEDYPSNLLRMNIYSQYMYIVLYLIMRVVPFVGHPVTDRLIVVLLCVVIRQILSWLMLILTTNFLKKCAKIFPIDYLPVAPIIITKYRQQNRTDGNEYVWLREADDRKTLLSDNSRSRCDWRWSTMWFNFSKFLIPHIDHH